MLHLPDKRRQAGTCSKSNLRTMNQDLLHSVPRMDEIPKAYLEMSTDESVFNQQKPEHKQCTESKKDLLQFLQVVL